MKELFFSKICPIFYYRENIDKHFKSEIKLINELKKVYIYFSNFDALRTTLKNQKYSFTYILSMPTDIRQSVN